MTFRERFVEADGFRIRYVEAGEGAPLVHLHGAGGPHLTPAHERLARRHRVIAFEMPGFGQSAENARTRTMPELATTMTRAINALSIDAFDLWGTSFGAKTALWLALQSPQRVQALALEAPAAIRQDGFETPPSQRRPLVERLRGPDRDAELELRLRELPTPTLVLLGTRDRVIAPAMGRVYKDLMPNAHLVFVYDAGHGISTDRPEAFTEVVEDFLERHEAFVISRAATVIHP